MLGLRQLEGDVEDVAARTEQALDEGARLDRVLVVAVLVEGEIDGLARDGVIGLAGDQR